MLMCVCVCALCACGTLNKLHYFSTLPHTNKQTGYLDQGLLVRDAAKLRKHYFTTKGWRLDFLSVLPTDFAYLWWTPGKCNVQVPCPVIVRLNRLFRLPRMLEWFERTETATGYPNAFRICKVSIIERDFFRFFFLSLSPFSCLHDQIENIWKNATLIGNCEF